MLNSLHIHRPKSQFFESYAKDILDQKIESAYIRDNCFFLRESLLCGSTVNLKLIKPVIAFPATIRFLLQILVVNKGTHLNV